MNTNIYSSSGFMPLSPLLCGDAENTNPFLKINSTTPTPEGRGNESLPPLEITMNGSSDEKSGSVKSGSSSDTDIPQKKGRNGQTIAVNKQEMAKLIEEQNLQKQRLLRKAEQARLSRKRKKMRMQELEKETEFLRSEVKRLKTTLIAKENKIAAMASANKALQPSAVPDSTEYNEMYNKLDGAVQEGKASEIRTVVDHMVRSFKSSKPDAEKYLKAFSAQISPSLPVRFLEWVLGKKETFYEDKSGLWYSLFAEEAGLTPDQMTELKKLRESRSSSPFNKEDLMKQLGSHLQDQCDHQEKMLDKISQILTPDQLAKFLLWVRKHGEVCIKIR
eukprot:CAMPEP_0184487830 /NCGR_PEP_ID=MMETSP0113_2-20130426/10357_1 /TAXON_ID=91329 /ORGANISM="Norrisiella sphaerica, Strain BC52" /LENGTH=332 /DNA_ID=CAMNT_0026870241 /DNA_START=561 /DNA_END=1559 /DNA_ORIENTATION=-